jgi:nucleoside phosphorylase
MLGDVVVGDQVDGYHVAAKVQGVGQLALSGDVHRSTHQLVIHANNLEKAYPEAFKSADTKCRAEYRRLLGSHAGYGGFLANNLARGSLHIRSGHIASGPFVVASSEFAEWLRDRDRKYVAVEMEAYGVLLGAHRGEVPGLVIRGISDLANERKTKMDSVGTGAIRRHAMRNASRVLLLLMQQNLL